MKCKRCGKFKTNSHKDFEITLDPYMTTKEAAKRRDLTINSISIDILDHTVLDPYNGLSDLENGIIRATDPNTFVEDPLRVLRIMQILPRKAKSVDPETVKLCRSLSNTFDTLSPERVFVEFEKLLMLAKKPSIGIRFLQNANWLKHFPELYNLIGCQHNPEHHPEGDSFIHSLIALDNAAIIKEWLPEDWKLAFMFGILLHDVGKPSTIDIEDKGSCKGHDKAGEKIAEDFMVRITNEKDLTNKVTTLVKLHMQPYSLTINKAKKNAWRRLQNKCRLDILGFMTLCDRAAAIPETFGNPQNSALKSWKHFFDTGEPVSEIVHKLMGRHLIDSGLEPGPSFGPMLDAAYEAQLDDDTLELDELFEIALGAKL